MDTYVLYKLALLVATVWFWFCILGKLIRGQEIGAILLLLGSTVLVGFCYMQGWLS